MPKKLTKSEFIERARLKHGDTYNYKLVKYINNSTKASIKCKIHGYFKQTPRNHLAGGCYKCGKESCSKKLKKDTETFIDEARAIHNLFYVYSKVMYVTDGGKVTITCPIHGDFEQKPNKHLKGQSCPDCGIIKYANKQRKTKKEFIADARKIHGNRYGYRIVKYINKSIEVSIRCKTHGYFKQRPDNHPQGQGCPDCVLKGLGAKKPNEPAILYSFRIKNTNVWKIGITNNTLEKRYTKTLVRETFDNIIKYRFSTGQEAFILEQKVLKRYSKYKYQGEPLLSSGNTELLTTNKAHKYLKLIQNLKESLSK